MIVRVYNPELDAVEIARELQPGEVAFNFQVRLSPATLAYFEKYPSGAEGLALSELFGLEKGLRIALLDAGIPVSTLCKSQELR